VHELAPCNRILGRGINYFPVLFIIFLILWSLKVKHSLPSISSLEEELEQYSDNGFVRFFIPTQIFCGVGMALLFYFSSPEDHFAVSPETGVFIGLCYAWAWSRAMTAELSANNALVARISKEISWLKK
jgi:hypothetical protein